MKYRRQGTAGDLAQGQSGGSGVVAKFVYQTAREFDGERHFGIADRDWAFELLCLFEVAIGLAPGDGTGLSELFGGLGQVLVLPQQGASQIEPFGFRGIAGTGHMTYKYVYLRHESRDFSSFLALLPIANRPLKLEVIFCVQAVITPLLANLYMNRMLKGWRQTGRAEQFRAQIVNYADDFVILSRGRAAEALGWTRGVLERLELTLNEKKTSLRNARQERFDFLGYTFGPHFSGRTGREYIGYSPSKKSVSKMKRNAGDCLRCGNNRPWGEVRDRLNQKLRGWKAYFELGSTARAYRALDEYVEERVRHFLRRRHKVSSQGTREFSMRRIYGELGIFRLRGPLRDAGS
jgi:hypothetical protein